MLLLAFIMSITAYAQNRVITGTVLDANGEPVIGATVKVKGSDATAVTNMDGRFSIETNGKATLVVSYIGFKTAEMAAANNMRVTLQEEANMLNEVVAIGYGSVKRRDVTTSVASISTDDLAQRPIVSAVQGMQGKAAGLQISSANGKPGGAPTIRVRGTTSLNGNNDPLYVVDGVPVTNIDFLSADDISDMQVLKDASSAAIYGSRAANGVIIINTKQGKAGVAKVSLSVKHAFNTARDNRKPLNTAQYKELMDETGKVHLPDGLTDQTNWFDEAYRTGHLQDYQVSVTNGNDKMRYYLSGGYVGETGVLRMSSYQRYNVRASIDNDLRSWLKIGASINYADYTNKGTDIISGTGASRGGVLTSIINTPTYAPVWNPEKPEQYYTNFYGVNLTSPLENLARNKDNKSRHDRLIATGKATITFLPELKLNSSISFDRSNTHSTNFLDPIALSWGRNQNGEGSDTRSTSSVWVIDNVLSYKNTFGKHTFDAMAGTSYTQSKWSQSYINGSDYADALIKTLNAANKISWTGTGSTAADWAIMSYFARLQYNFNDRYLLTGNIRADGSSKLAPGHRWGYFPSFSAAWRMSEESFMKNVDWLNDLKLRASWGQTGNQSGLGDYSYLASYSINRIEWFKTGNEHAVPTRTQSTLSNPELTWETTSQWDLGFDATLFNNRLTITADYYYKKTTDMLMSITLPAGAAAANNLTYNGGDMVNKGFEFSFNSKNLTGALKWNTDFNITFNRNKLTRLALTQVYFNARTTDFVNDYVVRNTPGRPLGSFYGYISDGVDPETGELMYRDVDGNGVINSSDRTYIGDPNPDFTFGLTNTFSYKGFNLSILLQGSVGNDVYNVARMETEGMYDGKNQSTKVLDRWRIPGQITDVPKAGFDMRNSTYFLENGSYLRVKDISLSYDVPKNIINKWGLTALRPYVSLSNMFTLTSYSGNDPEVNQYGNNGGVQGLDWGVYPLNKSVVLGLSVEF